MILFKQSNELQKYLDVQRDKGRIIGFVPTMGALHLGHVSLLDICNQRADISICSIFVNPTQFNDPKDFQKYPVTIVDDILKLDEARCKMLFLPSVDEMYPHGTVKNENYDLGQLEYMLEGAYRPGHFQGVCQVVHRLLDIVKPHKLFLGQKDFQQCLVIKKLIKLLNKPIEVIIAETQREESGLAMSSRNTRLNAEQRKKGSAIYRALTYIKDHINQTPIDALIETAKSQLTDAGFSRVDYVAIAEAETLTPLTAYDNNKTSVALIAAFMGNVRLIDNWVINPA